MLAMLEIERKILDINVPLFIRTIEHLKPKPKKVFDGLVAVKYFDFPDGSIRKKRDLLRLRKFVPRKGKPYTEIVYKIYKCVKSGCKYFDELEKCLPGTQAFRKLTEFFTNLGLVQTLFYEKKRTLYIFGKIKFEIDEHPKIPPFLEIEGPSPAKISKMVKILGLKSHEQTSETISELMERKYPKIRLNGLKF